MAGRRGASHGDMVTIIYPQGCREVTEELGSDELIRRLKSLAHTFQVLQQAEDESTYVDYTPLALHLADDFFLNHASRDVQLLVACCIADILRIFAPEAPYKDPAQIKIIFFFLIKQLGGLKDPKDTAFKRYFYLLENLAYVKSFNMCLDLEDCNEIFCALFSLMFKIVNDEHSGKVKTFMLDVLCPLLTEADFISNELLDIILVNIMDPYKSQRKNAASLARDLIVKTSSTLEPYIQQFFNQVLILGKVDNKLNISRKIFELIYELNMICPRILLTVLPQLEFKIKSTDEVERMGSVSLLARMFSEKGSNLAKNHRPLWLAFLGRYNDISVAIRTKCVQYTMHFLLNHPELKDDICETLKARQHDPEESVRYEVVIAIVTTVRKDMQIVAESEELLNFVKERTLDKKFKIRKEAISGLALIYKKYLTESAIQPEATKKAIKWIKDKIMHSYYMKDIEDRLLVERLMNTSLVPFNLESADRMKKLFLLFTTIDEYATKAFIGIQKAQKQARKTVSELLEKLKEKGDWKDKECQLKIHTVSQFLPNPLKTQEFLKKFAGHLLSDSVMMNALEKVVNDQDISCKECTETVAIILKKLGSPIMTNLYYGTIKQLLERISSVMIDREAIQHLVGLVKETLNNGSILTELDLDPAVATERGLRLLLVLAFVYPSHFLYQDIMKELLMLIKEDVDNVAAFVLQIFTFMGKKTPLHEEFPDILEHLVPVCKSFIRGGTSKQAKHAIKCLYINTSNTEESIFADVLEIVTNNLNEGFEARGEAYRTAIVALGHIAFHLPEKFPVQVKNRVSRNIVKELLMQDKTEAREDDGQEWCEFDDLPLETKCKIEGMKMMARWLVGLQSDAISAKKTFNMLNTVISSKGDLLEEGKPSPSERAWLRLAAGCAMLKICEQKGVGDEYIVEQYYTLSTLAMDPVKQVRSRFIAKLHKGLARGIPFKCLPLDFMGFYAIVGMENDKSIKDVTKRYMVADIAARKDCIKNLTYTSGDVASQLPNIMPDYMIVFAIAALAHHPEFESVTDIEFLKRVRTALWFVMEPLMSKNDNFSFGFYKALVEKIRNQVDALDEETYNEKLWAVCDLAISLLFSKTTNFELKEFPSKVTLSSLYFKTHPKGEDYVNPNVYIPQELCYQPPKKAGASLFVTRKVVANAASTSKAPSKASEKSEDNEEDNEATNDEEDPEDNEITDKSNDEDSQELKGRGGRKRGRAAASTASAGVTDDEEPPVAKKSSTENGDEATSSRPKRATRK